MVMMRRRIMASVANSVRRSGMQQKGQSAWGVGPPSKSPSLSPSPPQFPARKFESNSSSRTASNSGSSRGGNLSDSDSGIVSGIRDLSLRQKPKTPTHQFDNRRTFCSTGNRVLLRNLNDVANMLKENQAKNVVIVAGAGISTPSGIPDFRTPGTGLYDNLQLYNIPYPEAIFDIDFFHHNPRPFFTLAKELYPSGKYRPNYIHYFARLLNDRGMLLRMYTQNIDGLERLAGVPPDKVVEAHGTFASASCVLCEAKYRGSEIKDSIFEDKLPRCKKRGCAGIVKPDIVFFGEELPKKFYCYLKDMLQTDMLLVMGTSLEVQPFAGIIDTVRWTVPRVLFNRSAVGPFKQGKRAKDFVATGDLIENLQAFVEKGGMKEDMIDLITKSEGIFRLAAPPPPSETPAKTVTKNCKAAKTKTNDPTLMAMWKQNAHTNLYSDSDSSGTSDFVDTDSESSSSSGKQEMGARGVQQVRNGKLSAKPSASRSVPAIHSKATTQNGVGTRPISKKPPSGKLLNRNNSNTTNGHSGSRNFSLLTRRKDNPPSPSRPSHISPSSSRNNVALTRNGRAAANTNRKTEPSWTPNSVRRKPPIDVGISPNRKPPQAPGSHPMKPRSSSVNKALPETLHSSGSGFRAVINRVRSAKTPKLAYQHRASPKPVYDARIMTVNTSNSSSSDDFDERDDIDDDSSSDDSR